MFGGQAAAERIGLSIADQSRMSVALGMYKYSLRLCYQIEQTGCLCMSIGSFTC